jgi:hypothetical protein
MQNSAYFLADNKYTEFVEIQCIHLTSSLAEEIVAAS